MRHLPIYLDVHEAAIAVSGAGEMAAAKLRLLLKTSAVITVFGVNPLVSVREWSEQGKLKLIERPIAAGDAGHARLLYAANGSADEDARAAAIGRAAGALVNIIDNIDDSAFITPAMVDRDPVTVAIGTEGASPVLARRIKAQIEAQLDSNVGVLARIGKQFRAAASKLPYGRLRRAFWSEYYDEAGPAALAEGGEPEVRTALAATLSKHLAAASHAGMASKSGYVWIIGAGPGDPDLLTNQACRTLHDADVIVHDRLVSSQVLELARREAVFIEVGKAPGGKSWRQEDINALLVEQASQGLRVARLKSGDPTIYGRLDEEMDALDAAGIDFMIVPGITSALAAAARTKVSLTRRKRNSELRLLTGQDIDGFADQDWQALARPCAVAAIYMGVRAARFLQGRLLMHGADPQTAITVVENVSRANERTLATTLGDVDYAMSDAMLTGPAVILFGLTPRESKTAQRPVSQPSIETRNRIGASQ